MTNKQAAERAGYQVLDEEHGYVVITPEGAQIAGPILMEQTGWKIAYDHMRRNP